jgi:hypothetical protein
VLGLALSEADVAGEVLGDLIGAELLRWPRRALLAALVIGLGLLVVWLMIS